MGRAAVQPELVGLVAERFKALAEPARLHLLYRLKSGERTVARRVAETGLTQANVSKHLQILYDKGFVARRKDGLFTVYRLAGRDVFKLCDVMCERLKAEAAVFRRRTGRGR
jgi:DNA-binding transcriptional ArsR family regulator